MQRGIQYCSAEARYQDRSCFEVQTLMVSDGLEHSLSAPKMVSSHLRASSLSTITAKTHVEISLVLSLVRVQHM